MFSEESRAVEESASELKKADQDEDTRVVGNGIPEDGRAASSFSQKCV